jgi:hypothetical protein
MPSPTLPLLRIQPSAQARAASRMMPSPTLPLLRSQPSAQARAASRMMPRPTGFRQASTA